MTAAVSGADAAIPMNILCSGSYKPRSYDLMILSMFLGTLGARLFWNMLPGKRINIEGDGIIRAD